MKQYRPRTFLLFLPFWIMVSLFSGCAKSSAPITQTGFYFDTVISVTIYDSDDRSLLDECFAMAETYEKRFSRTVEDSDIWNINHAGGAAVVVHEDTVSLLHEALYYAELTNGRVDPTVSAVKDLWVFSKESAAVLPENDALTEALTHVDYHNLLISGSTVCLKDKQASIDLGFIAKGFIADRMTDYLQLKGVKSALINLGGNVAAVGDKPDGTPFIVGIQKPFAPSGTPVTTLPISGSSAVTSGSYERYFELDGRIYHHILDAKTGYPIGNNLSGVTILSDSSVTGDALSTTCFVLGLTEGMELIESLKDTEALFITTEGTLYPSSGLALP